MKKEQLHLNLKIICLDGLKYDGYIYSCLISLKDGLMSINKNYASVIEEVKKGSIKIYENQGAKPSIFNISDGWMVVAKNKCEVFVTCANRSKK